MKESHIFGILAFLTGVQAFVLLAEITSFIGVIHIFFSSTYVVCGLGVLGKWYGEDKNYPVGYLLVYLSLLVMAIWMLLWYEKFAWRPLFDMEMDFLQIHFNIALASFIVSVVNLVQVIRSKKNERESSVSPPKINGKAL